MVHHLKIKRKRGSGTTSPAPILVRNKLLSDFGFLAGVYLWWLCSALLLCLRGSLDLLLLWFRAANGNLDLLRLRLGALCHRNGQDAVVVGRLHTVCVHARRQREAAREDA